MTSLTSNTATGVESVIECDYQAQNFCGEATSQACASCRDADDEDHEMKKLHVSMKNELNKLIYERSAIVEGTHPEVMEKSKNLVMKADSRLHVIDTTLQLAEKNYADILSFEIQGAASYCEDEILKVREDALALRTQRKNIRKLCVHDTKRIKTNIY